MIKAVSAHIRAYVAKTHFLVSAAILTVAVFSVLFSASVYGKNVTINVDGEEKQVFVFSKSAGEALAKASVNVGEHDELSFSNEEEIQNGQILYIKTAFPVKFTVNGEESVFYTTRKTLSNFLEDNEIALAEYDDIYPSLTTILEADMSLVLHKADVEVITEQEKIPYKTLKVPSHAAASGSTKVKINGEEGLKEITYTIVRRNGEVISKKEVGSQIIKNPVDKVTEYGTVEAVISSRGDNFRYRKVLNMRASAYDLSFSSTGKRPGDAGYGKTASGMMAARGVVAVDPKVIPLGTKLYIESADGKYIYGNAVAGDTGGAIKGNKIDLFMNSASECRSFGVRDVVVYILE